MRSAEFAALPNSGAQAGPSPTGAAAYTESVLGIQADRHPLIGIVSMPADRQPCSGVLLILVGGPQYRVGSHRQFTLLARHLAANGITVLRFDYAGMGDSPGEPRDFSAVSADIGAAIDALQARWPDLGPVTLWGLCDAASAALLYVDATADRRVTGLCLVNPWVRSEATLARAQLKHYYTARLRQPEFWKKLLSGRVALQALGGLLSSWQTMRGVQQGHRPGPAAMTYQQRMARAWRQFPGSILLLLSEHDLVAREFSDGVASDADWVGALKRPKFQMQRLPDADHTCSDARSRALVETTTLAWCQKHAANTSTTL